MHTGGVWSQECRETSIHLANTHTTQYCSICIVVLENVEHCGGKPEQADTGIYEYMYVTDE